MSPHTSADNSTEHPSKRTKLESQKDKFHQGLLETASSLQTAYAASKPYLHCKIDKLVNEDLLRKVRKEILSNLHFTLKETDIYKVYQTGDLANLDGLPADELAKLESLFELRNALYSPEFREFISTVTGCGHLSGTKTDMSINSYNGGCHLLNHDDVIGTRRVSYILYLTDPENPWDPKDGGALELYPVIEKGIPATEPTVVLPPQWNQFVMFTVQPGHSFHSVEEVVPENKPRLSISGWFHIPQEGELGYQAEKEEGESKSSLEQLQMDTDSSDKFTKYEDELDDEATDGLSKEDLEALAEWMNPHYLNIKMLGQISERFMDESAVQCKDIINKSLFAELKQATEEADKRDGLTSRVMVPHGTGTRGQWVAHGPPHRCRYMTLDKTLKSEDDPTSKLFADLQEKLSSEPFRRWLAVVTQMVPQGFRGEARRFRPGHDYTLATTNTRGQGVLDATLTFATTPNKKSANVWEGGECGGYECYMAPHDDEEDAAIYKAADDEGALLTLPAGCNELSLVLRDEDVMRFVKYVSARAPGSRWDLSFEYDLPEETEENEDEEKEEDK
ncbi:Oxoglutarate and iron-dependent oxygenase degradation C-term-domain-containing protein [Phycomyces blakesleeanus]|uniref:Oxoglutarate and iron-dependent oxygenase degradation C-term-domain-containing protein n=2 Tax=Phycomyces blakesleeanus TaxID=4837 RepID=A0ABR3BDZ0_PHYBL